MDTAQTFPREFTKAAVAEASKNAQTPYRDFFRSGEPYTSLMRHNPWLKPPRPDEVLQYGEGRYFDTTVAEKHDYWKDKNLPSPTKDLAQLRSDFAHWGYCLIEDGTSPKQTRALHQRVQEQAAAERALGIAYLQTAQQQVWSLVNKGEMFVECMTHEPSSVQAGPLIEQLLNEALGSSWHHLSFISNISYPGCHPQGMHQDQSLIGSLRILDAPILVNTIYILQDVDEVNGGTLIIPGSHRLYCEGGGRFSEVPPPINLKAPAGTIMLKDGRVLHGGAVNHSKDLRYILTNSVVRPFIRQQELFHLTIRPDILKTASDKFLWRCGFQATAARSMVEGFGYFGSGKPGDPNGSTANARMAMDENRYQWLGPLSMQDVESGSIQGTTLAQLQSQFETHRDQARSLMQQIDAVDGEL